MTRLRLIHSIPRPAVLAARDRLEDALAHCRDHEHEETQQAARDAYRLITLYVDPPKKAA